MKVIKIETSPSLQPTAKARLEYTLAFFSSHPSKPAGVSITSAETNTADLHLQYGKDDRAANALHIPRQAILFEEGIVDTRQLVTNEYAFEDTPLYSVERQRRTNVPFFAAKAFGFDLFETVFFHISRYEEVFADTNCHDEWDMLREEVHFLIRHQIHRIPVVDHLVFSFYQALNLRPTPVTTFFELSHDVDAIRKYPSLYKFGRATARLIIDKELVNIPKLAYYYLQSVMGLAPDPYDTFGWLLSDTGLPKTIYLMAGGITAYDNHYRIEDRQTRSVIDLAVKKGYQIGLHPSYATWKSEVLFRAEQERLAAVVGEEITESRQHFLHFSFLKTPVILDKVGIKTDSTLGFQNTIGFRCGTGFSYHLYNFAKEKKYRFLEKPMVIMDVALLRNVNYDIVAFSTQLDRFLKINRQHTAITFNFHNSSFDPVRLDAKAFQAYYSSLIAGLSSLSKMRAR